MNYEWTPISEPPSDNEDVVVWVDYDQGYWIKAYYEKGKWYDFDNKEINIVNCTHWKDIKPPIK